MKKNLLKLKDIKESDTENEKSVKYIINAAFKRKWTKKFY